MEPPFEAKTDTPEPVQDTDKEASDEEVHDVNPDKNETVLRSRKNRPTGSIHFGDHDFDVAEEYGDATWSEVCNACCCHTPQEWGYIFVGLVLVCLFLYFFLFALELLGSGAKVMTGCKAGELFGDDTNPIAGVMVGILSTVLLQSSSTTTSIIVSLTGSAISVRQGIYMVMGANIGTSVTNTIVAVGQMGDGDQLERAFAGATVHDMFNFMSVAILLPLEVVSGYLYHLTKAMVKGANPEKGESWEGPIKKLVEPIANKIIISNKKLIEAVAEDEEGNDSCSVGGGFYPIICDGTPTYDSCTSVGLIACSKKTGDCPSFFSVKASQSDDKVSGGVVFFISICILFFCLLCLVTILQKMLMGMSSRIIYKATDVNGYIAIAIGAGITILVQSSSITTSALTPLVGYIGVLRLEQMYPLTLGANIGTTVTAILAALVSEGTEPLQVALAHLLFNITGICIFYPVPFMRRIPIHAARQLGKATRVWRGFPLLYIAVMFFLVPIVFLGLSSLFTEDTKGFTVLGSFITVILAIGLFWTFYWFKFKEGQQKCVDCMAAREERRVVTKELPEEMKKLRAKVAALIEHTGYNEEEEEDDKADEVEKEEQASDEVEIAA